jgi:hypothetical protein
MSSSRVLIRSSRVLFPSSRPFSTYTPRVKEIHPEPQNEFKPLNPKRAFSSHMPLQQKFESNSQAKIPGQPKGMQGEAQDGELGVGELEGATFRVEPLRRTGEDESTMRARLLCKSPLSSLLGSLHLL